MKKIVTIFLILSMASVTGLYAQEAERSGVANVLESYENATTEDGKVLLPSFPDNSLARDIAADESADFSEELNKKHVSLEASDMPLSQAIDLVAAQSGETVTGQETVTGNVTVYFDNVGFLDALRVLCDAGEIAYEIEPNSIDPSKALIRIITSQQYESQNGFAFDQNFITKIMFLKNVQLKDIQDKLFQIKGQSGQLIVDEAHAMVILLDTPQRVASIENYIKERDVPIKTETFKLRYVQGANVISSIESMLTKDLGASELNAENNSVTVTDTESKIKTIEKFIKELDQQNKEVVVSVKTVQVTLNDEHQEGIDWEAIVSDYQSLPFEGLEAKTDDSKILSLGSLTEEDLAVLLDALDTVGLPNVLSDSKMTVDFNEDFELGVDDRDLMLMSEPKVVESMDGQERKVKFYLYTFSAKEGELTLKIRPELLIDGATQSSPQEMKVNLKDGSTVIIGSLFKTVTIASTRKVPFLGDLPFLGFAFRNQGQKQLRTETIIFVSLKTISKEMKDKNDEKK